LKKNDKNFSSDVLANSQRVVLKVGSSLLCQPDGTVQREHLSRYAKDITEMREQGKDVILVSSGAIALGRAVLGIQPPLRLDEKQAAAATGQTPLTTAWQSVLSSASLRVAQILLTLEDTENRKRYLNARATIETLLSLGVIPLVNENDTIATTEIRYGDNDRLAAHTAQMMGADLLILLSDIDGLYTANPNEKPTAKHLPYIPAITKEIENYAAGPNAIMGVGSGGMITKLSAARIATNAGSHVIIANGRTNDHSPLKTILYGTQKSTLFPPAVKALTARQQWIAGRQKPVGEIYIDTGATKAVLNGSSLLPAGITNINGQFQRGDLVSVHAPDNRPIALGLAAYESQEVDSIKGVQSKDIEAILGYHRRPSVIHTDDLVITDRQAKNSQNLFEENKP